MIYLLSYLITCILTYFLTYSMLVKKFLAFYGARSFITAFTNSRQLSLSWARSIQSMTPHPIFRRFILILSSHLLLGIPSGLFPSGFLTKILYTALLFTIRATCPSHLILLDLITRRVCGEEYRSLSYSLCSFLPWFSYRNFAVMLWLLRFQGAGKTHFFQAGNF